MSRWLSYFPLDKKLLILDGDNFKVNPWEELEQAQDFLGLRREITKDSFVYSDEKDFTVAPYHNRRHSRYIAVSPEAVDKSIKYVGSSKFPAKAMMLGIICSDGKKLPPIWIEGNMDGPKYKQILSRKVFPVRDATYGKGNYLWQQDGASCHTCNIVQDYLHRRLGSGGFWSKVVWPPNSPNLNPLDYHTWTHIEEQACATPHPNVSSLKTSVEFYWDQMSAELIISVCKSFRARLEKCIDANGGIFEQ